MKISSAMSTLEFQAPSSSMMPSKSKSMVMIDAAREMTRLSRNHSEIPQRQSSVQKPYG